MQYEDVFNQPANGAVDREQAQAAVRRLMAHYVELVKKEDPAAIELEKVWPFLGNTRQTEGVKP
ncbi:MAG: hypothetical protein IPK87_10560 [Planctomycetes bacterium]|nr:hypothetical protein [Planctomycetota bacterium]